MSGYTEGTKNFKPRNTKKTNRAQSYSSFNGRKYPYATHDLAAPGAAEIFTQSSGMRKIWPESGYRGKADKRLHRTSHSAEGFGDILCSDLPFVFSVFHDYSLLFPLPHSKIHIAPVSLPPVAARLVKLSQILTVCKWSEEVEEDEGEEEEEVLRLTVHGRTMCLPSFTVPFSPLRFHKQCTSFSVALLSLVGLPHSSGRYQSHNSQAVLESTVSWRVSFPLLFNFLVADLRCAFVFCLCLSVNFRAPHPFTPRGVPVSLLSYFRAAD